MNKILLTFLLFLSGCSMPISHSPFSPGGLLPPQEILGSNSSAAGFEMLPWLGGVAILGGLALLVISGGRKGWYPLLIGIGLILLNWIVLTYAHALFIPVVVATGSLTLAVGYKVVTAILNKEH